MSDPHGQQAPLELPPYRAVLVVDTMRFGSGDDPTQYAMADTMMEIISRAFERAGLAEVWDEAVHSYGTGDGMAMGFDTKYLPFVIGTFFDALQDELADRDRRFRAHHRNRRMRMRAALHVGPVRKKPDGEAAGITGQTVVTTHRMVDTQPLREALERSDEDITFLAAALSERVYQDVVAAGYSSVTTSRVVDRSTEIKEFAGRLYLYVPKPSGGLLDNGIGERQPAPEPTADEPQPQSHGETYNNYASGQHGGTTIQVGRLNGGIKRH